MGTPSKHRRKSAAAHTPKQGVQKPDTPSVSKMRSRLRNERKLYENFLLEQVGEAIKKGDGAKAARFQALASAQKEIIITQQIRAIAADLLPEAAAFARKGKYRLLQTVAEILERTGGKIDIERALKI